MDIQTVKLAGETTPFLPEECGLSAVCKPQIESHFLRPPL